MAISLEGRWDITVDMNGKPAPSWLEVRHSGNRTLVGQFVSVSGSARPISEVHVKDNTFHFAIPPQWESGTGDFSVKGTFQGDKISGSLTTPDGKTYSWTGVRAPSLRRTSPPVWGKPIKLTQGNSLTGWHAEGTNQWVIKDGVLKSEKSGANLITDQKFNDFKLHVEFRIPKGSNSGVYLRGRYEVQVTDGKGMEPSPGELGGVYGFISPSEMMAKEPGEWQSFDVTLIGRMITLAVNGKTVITNQEIPGITGGALDSNEGEPGPLYIQGDHGPVEYRNIVITPAN
ncbi:3-keto-disaccharide hydrolase [Arundinibacter roseus]|nr:DUF1080 domain-containing protein [Arundinibacter roseus]